MTRQRRAVTCTALAVATGLLICLLAALSQRALAADPVQRPDVHREIEALAAEELQTLQELFTLDRRRAQVGLRIAEGEATAAALQAEIDANAAHLDQLRISYDERRRQLARRLRYLHERGRLQFIEVLLSATDFRQFLFRMGVIRHLIAADVRMLQDVRSLRADIETVQSHLLAQQRELVALQAELRADLAEVARLMAEREQALAALQEDRARFEALLAAMETQWVDQVGPVLTEVRRATQLLEQQMSHFEPDSLNFSIFPPGATVVVLEETFNRFLREAGVTPALSVRFLSEAVEVVGDFAGVTLLLSGRFTIAAETVLRFEPQRVMFAGVEIAAADWAAVVPADLLDLQLSEMVRPGKLKKVQSEGGRLVLQAGL